MGARDDTRHVDRLVARLAASQHGVVAREQLVALGLGRGAIAHRLRSGRLHHLYRGVYAVGHPRISVEGRRLAAVLACGDGAVLSHRTAAAHWGLRPDASRRIEVTVPTTSPRRPGPLVVVHRTRRPVESVVEDAIPVTTPARTLLDLAGVIGPRQLDRAVEQAEKLRLFDLAAVRAVLGHNPGRRTAPLIRAIARHDDAPARSELERRFLELCAENRIDRPVVNGLVAGFEVDFHWPRRRLIAETDGRHHHGTRAAFERDRERDAALAVAGWRVVRFTWRRVVDEPREVAAMLAALTGAPAF